MSDENKTATVDTITIAEKNDWKHKAPRMMALIEMGNEDFVFFGTDENPEFDGGILGVSNDGRLIYSYSKMVEWYAEHNKCGTDDAVDWIEFNTMRSLPYMGADAPIILMDYGAPIDDYIDYCE